MNSVEAPSTYTLEINPRRPYLGLKSINDFIPSENKEAQKLRV